MCLTCKHLHKLNSKKSKNLKNILYINSPICFNIRFLYYIYPNLEGISLTSTYINQMSNKYKKLKYLYANYSALKYIPYNLNLLIELRIAHSLINILPHNLFNLMILDCSNTNITYIPDTLYNLTKLYISNTKIKELPNTLTKLKVLDCSYTRIKFIPETYNMLERLNCQCSNIKIIPETLINLLFLNCSFTSVNSISKNFLHIKSLKIKYTNIKRLHFNYKSLEKLELNNIIYFHNVCQEYIAINFLLNHFKTKFKFVNKFKMINKKSILQYHNFILDRYLNPQSLSLIYKINKWNHNYFYPELLYLNDKNELIISQILL